MNIIIINNFYINIVLEIFIIKLGIWYYRLDIILRKNLLGKSTVICELICEYNIIFLQYKLFYIYKFSQFVNISIVYIIINIVFKVGIRKKKKYVLGYIIIQKDLEKFWYLRLGYLGLLVF